MILPDLERESELPITELRLGHYLGHFTTDNEYLWRQVVKFWKGVDGYPDEYWLDGEDLRRAGHRIIATDPNYTVDVIRPRGGP